MDIEEAEPEEASLHVNLVNPWEAKEHIHFLDKAIETMETKIKEGEVEEVMVKGTLERFKEVITNIIPTLWQRQTWRQFSMQQ